MFSIAGIATLAVVVAQYTPPASIAPDRGIVVTGTVGRGSTWDDEGRIGAGLSTGGGAEWRFHRKLSAAFRVERLGHERHMAQDLRLVSGRTLFATGEVKYRFRSAGVAPYAIGGYGVALYSGTLVDRVGVPLMLERSSRSGVIPAGVGIEIPIGSRFVVSPEVRILMCQPKDDFATWAAIRGGISAGWRF